MDAQTIFDPYAAGPDITVLPSYAPIPGFGIVPANAFVLMAGEPVLVDAGLWSLSDAFMENLASIIDPKDLRWLWLTHNDHDHIGSLHRLLAAAPDMKVVTNYLGLGKMGLFQPFPMDRVFLINPGQGIDVGDRRLTAVRPPTYDAPETTGFYDHKAKAFFSADCFGTLMKSPADSASAIAQADLEEGLLLWSTIDCPWLHLVDRERFRQSIQQVLELSPELILSSHLPAARGMTAELLAYVAAVPDQKVFVGPDQQALEAMLAMGPA
jgi:flavorubredoxin